MGTVGEALSRGRRVTLEAIRDHLASILDGGSGHEPGCDCECGTPWDAGKSAGIARELRAVMLELDNFPQEGGGSEFDSVQREREERRLRAQAEAEGL